MRNWWWKLIDRIDEWAHVHGLMKPVEPLRWLCNYRERGIMGAEEYRRYNHVTAAPLPSPYFDFVNGFVTTTSAGNTISAANVTWTKLQ